MESYKMNKLTIANEFFNLNSPISKGLISALKKLQQNGFSIFVDDFDIKEKLELNKILELEDIRINPKDNKKPEKSFNILTKDNSQDNSIIVAENSDIDTFEKAADKIIKNLRTAKKRRKTKETDIEIEVNLDGTVLHLHHHHRKLSAGMY